MNLCCPEGQAHVDSGQLPPHHRCDDPTILDTNICQPREGTETAIQKFTNKWKLPDNVNFEGGSNEHCREKSAAMIALSGETSKMKVVFENDKVLIKYDNDTKVWPNEDACLMPYERETPKGQIIILPKLYICKRKEFKTIKYVYPVMILLSSFFMLLTLAVYLILKDLREQLFGKITVGFLVNVTINFILNGVNRCLDLHPEADHYGTWSCKFLGYLSHYTFISFFMWMNAMAINMTNKFRKMRKPEKPSALKVFLVCLYCQGLPALLSMTIAIIDETADCVEDRYKGDKVRLPNMGRLNCFLHTPQYYGDEKEFFHQRLHTAEFLYYYMIVAIIVVINTICFFITGFSLWRHFKDVQSVRKYFIFICSRIYLIFIKPFP